jgi:hypothetical protein
MLSGKEPYQHGTLKKTPQPGEINWAEKYKLKDIFMDTCPHCKVPGTLKKTPQYSEMDPLIYCNVCNYVYYARVKS